MKANHPQTNIKNTGYNRVSILRTVKANNDSNDLIVAIIQDERVSVYGFSQDFITVG